MKGRILFMTLSMALVLILAQVLLSGCRPGTAAYPEKNITFVVPMGAGGGYDTYARGIAPFMEKYLPKKVHIVVENMEGAEQVRGISYVNKSPPDGYTFGMVSFPGMVITQLLQEVPFDLTKVAYIGSFAKNLIAIYVRGNSPINSLADLKAAAEKMVAEKKKMNWTNPGIGTTSDLFTRLLLEKMGLTGKVTTIGGYKGTKDAMTAVIRGDGEFSPATDDAFADMVKKGNLKVIAVIGPKRARVYPNVPSTAEQGYPEFGEEFVFWRPLFCPPKTPDGVMKILERALMQALADPDLLAWAKKVDYSIDPLPAKETLELVNNIQKTFTGYVPFLKSELAK